MENEKKINLLKEALFDYTSGKLTELSIIIIFDSILNEIKINNNDIKWAKKNLKN